MTTAKARSNSTFAAITLTEKMMQAFKTLIAITILTYSAGATAWWGPFDNDDYYHDGYRDGSPWNGNRWNDNRWHNNNRNRLDNNMFSDMMNDVMGDMSGDMDVEIKFKIRGRGKGKGNGRGYGEATGNNDWHNNYDGYQSYHDGYYNRYGSYPGYRYNSNSYGNSQPASNYPPVQYQPYNFRSPPPYGGSYFPEQRSTSQAERPLQPGPPVQNQATE